MKRILSLTLATCIFASFATPAPAAPRATLTVAAAFHSNPPKQGMETILITVKDATGKPVRGASVTVASNMPTMSMSGPTAKAHDNGDGTYAAKTNINFATKWTFDIVATSKHKTVHTVLIADVKS